MQCRAGEICPFVRIVDFIVKFLGAIRITNIAPLFGADRVVLVSVCCNRGNIPFLGRITEQWDDAFAVQMARQRKATQFTERWIDRHEIDSPLTDSRLCGRTGRYPNQRSARGLFPEGKLSPMLLFSQMPTMVTPQDDNRIVLNDRTPRANRSGVQPAHRQT